MIKNARMIKLIGFFLMVYFQPAHALEQEWSKTFVRITTYIQETDIDAPWRTLPVREEVHMGIVMDAKHILVSAYAVAHSRNFEYQLTGSSERQPLQLAFVDYNINLALLTPPAHSSLQGLQAVRLGDDLRLGEEASVYTARVGQRLINFPMRIREVIVQSALFSPYQLPHYAFDTQKRSAGWSEPIVRNDRLVGMAISKREETVFAAPVSIIRRFFEEAVSEKYRGLPRLGLVIESLTSPELRAHAGLKAGQQGVWIGLVQKNSVFYGALQPGDVLVQLDDIKLNEQGLYDHPYWGRLSFIGALYQYREGDIVNLQVLRNGQPLSIKKELTVYDSLADLIPWDVPRDEPYLIFGGLLFQELSQSYLKKWGREWRERAPLFLLQLWNFQNVKLADEQQRIIVLNRVLADSVNKGYEGLRNLQLVSLNGEAVHSLQHLSQILTSHASRADQEFAVFQFAPYYHQVILRFDDLAGSNDRIVSNYEVREQIGFWQQVERTATLEQDAVR